MKETPITRFVAKHATVLTALAVTAIFAIRFIKMLPFSGKTRPFNYETITTLASVFIYNNEPFGFPLGVIKGLTFPFHDANIGSVGGIPLFGVLFKALGQIFPYFKTFDYFILVELISCFLTAYFSQKVLSLLGVKNWRWRAFGAVVSATSFLLLNRSSWLQPFCVASFPIFVAWIYGMLLTLMRGHWKGQDFWILVLFPVAALVDYYSFVGILLGTGILILREIFELIFGGLDSSRNRISRLVFFCFGGVILSLIGLFLVGMYPLPHVPSRFTSYDFGIGGRYHVADLFAQWIPVANQKYAFGASSLPAKFGFPWTTDILAPGQYEGVGYIGASMVLVWLGLGLGRVFSLLKNFQNPRGNGMCRRDRSQDILRLYSPWKKLALASGFIFVFSLGYELHILGHGFSNFAGMPAAWIADRLPSLYNIRATGRLAILPSLFLIFEGIRRLELKLDERIKTRLTACVLIAALLVIHFFEVGSFLKPLSSQSILPLGHVFSEEEINTIKRLANGHRAVLIAPSIESGDTDWITTAFTVGFYAGIPTNLYYIARNDPAHEKTISKDIKLTLAGDWDGLSETYGDILFAIPRDKAAFIREKVKKNYDEIIVGPISIWSRRTSLN